jgi:hypothetical protein
MACFVSPLKTACSPCSKKASVISCGARTCQHHRPVRIDGSRRKTATYRNRNAERIEANRKELKSSKQPNMYEAQEDWREGSLNDGVEEIPIGALRNVILGRDGFPFLIP